MKYNPLGQSGLFVSEISFGCMSLGTAHSENEIVLHQALSHGINFFDTADVYQKGENEISVGRAFKGMRDRVVIATKVGNEWNSDGSGFNWNPTKSYILHAVEKSLLRLQTDYIDLYQLHGGTIDDPVDDTIEAFEILKQQGKIRHYGISSIRPNVIREYVKRAAITSVMMQYSLLDRRPEENCLELLHNNNIGVIARGSLAKGLLVDKPSSPYLNYTQQEVEDAKLAIHRVSTTDRKPTHTAIHFVLHHPAITTAALGIRTLNHLESVASISETKMLSENEMIELRRSISSNTYDQHR